MERLSETTIAFSLDTPDAVTFLPGQYANLLVPGTDQRRCYSFSSPPGAHTLSFLVRNIPPGVMSTYLREKAVPGTIRGDLALITQDNLVHGSDSPESAAREIELWFPGL